MVAIFFFLTTFLLQSLEKSCGGNYMDVHPSNAKCVKDLQAYKNVKIIIQTLLEYLLYLPQTNLSLLFLSY